jgi:hypothetical protein
MLMKKNSLNVKRLEINQVEKKLNTLLGLPKNDNTSEPAFLTILTLTEISTKHKLPAGAPFPAIVKRGADGVLAVFSCVNAKQEIIPEHGYREPTPVGKSFEYKGRVYQRNPVLPLYTLKR